MSKMILSPDQRLRIFVSSTIDELSKERKAVYKVIKNNFKLHPLLFEAGASPHPPKDKYEAWIQQSDIFIGIYWESYGWIAPDMTISGIEDEYNIAQKSKRDRLVYLKTPKKRRDKRLTELINRIKSEKDICYKSFATIKELVELVSNDIALRITERYRYVQTELSPHEIINYLNGLEEDRLKCGFIERPDIYTNIESILEADHKVLLVGEPGSGKTFMAGKYGTDKKGIYISIKEKPPLNIYTFITNSLRIKDGLDPKNYLNTDEVLSDLELSLQKSKETLIIDDADFDVPFTRTLLGLEYSQNRVLFVARDETVLGGHSLRKVTIIPFSRYEIEAYLISKQIQLTPGKLLELIRSCQGNPLYLYYFTNYQIDPLPDSLKAYQDALWREINPIGRELLGLISLSIFPIILGDLSDARNKLENSFISPMEIVSHLTSLSSIIRIRNGYYELFHHFFKEDIAKRMEDLGLAQTYHRVLGEVSFEHCHIVKSTYHFMKAHDKREFDYLFEAGNYAHHMGLWGIAESLFRRQIDIAQENKDLWTEGYSRYHLAFLLQDKGNLDEARIQINKSIETFRISEDHNWERIASVHLYLDLINEGKAAIAIHGLKQYLELYEGVDPLGEAMILTNLSYAYIQISHYEEGANAAKRAFDIFAKENEYSGLMISFSNLTACLGELGNYKLALKYSKAIVHLATVNGNPRLKALGLNQLGFSLRKKKDPVGAIKCLEEAVDICQRLGYITGEVLNILNLGNAYKDKDDILNAEKCYQEGLAKAQKYKIKKEEGRALELLASIKRSKGQIQEAIDYATKSISIQNAICNSLRIAESYKERAESYKSLCKYEEAARDYEEAAKHYSAVFKLNDSVNCYEQASRQWIAVREDQLALAILGKAITYSLEGNRYDIATQIIEEFQREYKIKGLEILYLNIIENYVKNPSIFVLPLTLYAFSSYCKQLNISCIYIKALNLLAENVTISPNITNTLIAGISQADERLMKTESLHYLLDTLQQKLGGFSYRKMPNGSTVWTGIWSEPKQVFFQIECLSERNIDIRLSLILILTVLGNKDTIIENIDEHSRIISDTVNFILLGQEEFENKVMRLPSNIFAENRPAVFLRSNVPFNKTQPKIPIIINNHFGVIADWHIYPENIALIMLVMSFYISIVEQIAQKRNIKYLHIRARNLCEIMFGLHKVGKTKTKYLPTRWQISNLKTFITELEKRDLSTELLRPVKSGISDSLRGE